MKFNQQMALFTQTSALLANHLYPLHWSTYFSEAQINRKMSPFHITETRHHKIPMQVNPGVKTLHN